MFFFSYLFHALIFIMIYSGTICAQDHVSYTLVTRLVHYLSVDSPYFDPNTSTRDLSRIDLESSIFRAMYLAANTSGLVYPTDIETQLSSATNGYFAHLKVGSNEIDQLVFMDTGSSLLWINCYPCVLTVPEPIFDPLKSYTFQKEYCLGHDACGAPGAVSVQCHGSLRCSYEVRYSRDQYTKGYLARESFKFGRSHEILEDVIFGCSRSTSLRKTNGVFGLGVSSLSFLGQRYISKFAYCIGNIGDRSYPYNTLAIGDEIYLLGDRTTLIQEGKYFLTLEGIMIGNKALEIDPVIFRRNSADFTGGMVVDTGSTYTFFPQIVWGEIRAEVANLIGSSVSQNYSIKYKDHIMLCYNGVLTRDLKDFPVVVLQFEGNAIMVLQVENVFYQYNDRNFCLAILPSELAGVPFSILGNVMQQNFYIAYDIKTSTFAFERMDCKLMDRYIRDEL